MRDELTALLDEIRGREPDPGLGLLADAIARGDVVARIRPPLKDRSPMWDLAIKLMRELGTEVDERPGADSTAPAPRLRRRGRVDYG